MRSFARKATKFVQLIIEGELARLQLLKRKSLAAERSRSLQDLELAPDNAAVFFIDGRRRDDILQRLEMTAESASRVVIDADEICNNSFHFLGVSPGFVNKIDWHLDIKTGRRWPSWQYYKLVQYFGLGEPADIKLPWELSRFLHLPTLGKAYWLTANEKYTSCFRDQVLQWLDANPRPFGVNWTCTMEVAIRAMNWLWGWYFFQDSSELSDSFKARFVSSLFEHGTHISKNLEILNFEGKTYKNNHYLADICGLLYLGLFFRSVPEGRKWLQFAIKSLNNEMFCQVNSDGTSFEASIPYHRLATECFLYAALLCELNGVSLPADFVSRLELMLDFIATYTKPNGSAPQIGDADDGRLHILSEYSHWNRQDHRYLLAIGGLMLNRPDLCRMAPEKCEERDWMLSAFDRNSGTSFANLGLGAPILTSQPFTAGGYFVMRHEEAYMILSAGGVGTGGLGAHKHCDVFSFELSVGEADFIVDPGSYTYTGDMALRNKFRSTEFHNTVQVDRLEQNDINIHRPFLMRERANPIVEAWESTPAHDYFCGNHSGYSRFLAGMIHRRHVYFDKAEHFWLIFDQLGDFGGGARQREVDSPHHDFVSRFHFASDVQLRYVHAGPPLKPRVLEVCRERFSATITTDLSVAFIEAHSSSGTVLQYVPLLEACEEIEFRQSWVSPSYGVRCPSRRIEVTKRGRTVNFLTLFQVCR